MGVVIVAPACFLPTPPIDADPTEDGSSSSSTGSGASSSGEAPTTGGESSSSEPAGTSTGEAETSTTTGSTTEDDDGPESSGTTEFSLPLCPYDPPGVYTTLTTSDNGAMEDLSVQMCGAAMTYERLKLVLMGASLTFAACSDAGCGDCDLDQQVDLGLFIPDPFSSYGGGVLEGGCYELGMAWDRPTDDDPAMCRASTVTLRKILEGAPEVVPSLIYRLSPMLDVSNELGTFALAAAPAGAGKIKCPCDGDCCRETPGTRDVQFTIHVGAETFMGEPLEAEQSQDVALSQKDGEPDKAGISLVRSHFPSDCAALPTHEWVFTFPAAF